MADHPFKKDTQIADIFTILSDGEWHCAKHELPGTQPAKPVQIIRQHGYDIEKKKIFCEVCKYKTVHRRLISTEPVQPSFIRQPISARLRKRVLEHYHNIEAISMREMFSNQLEVDHRFPQVRWSKDESYDPDMSEDLLHRSFQLLTRQNNLWKSRYCEHCAKTGERGTFIGINFFAVGGPKWDTNFPPDDEHGCFGCFWYHPDVWRNALNKIVEEI
jgi:hypothetical protein